MSVLVVDDEPDIREVIEIALSVHGYEVTTVTSGEECMRFLRDRERPSVILLDLMMPEMSGWEVCRQLSNDPALSTIPIVILTGGNATAESCPGATTVLRKPIQLERLIEVIARHAGPPCAPALSQQSMPS
ncbi:MAG: response regulator [Labilithrix sp.]|nr:response regulator [Labilithrix sp.]